MTCLIGGWLVFIPMNRVRHIENDSVSRQKVLNRIRRRRGSIPPPYPNGWYIIAQSTQVTSGSKLRVSALGREFLIYRGLESNEVFVVDPYCPHLGADIYYGGEVSKDSIICPFHHWKFDGHTGDCISIPYSKNEKRPSTKLKTVESSELNGHIYIWYHANETERPLWRPVTLETFSTMSYQGRSEYEISCHIQDIPENGADVNHLDAIHRTGIIAGGNPGSFKILLSSLLAYHKWEVNWTSDDKTNPHIAKVSLNHKMIIFGRFQTMDLNVKAYQIGPSIVHLHFQSPFFGEGVMIQSIIPVQPFLQKVIHTFYTNRFWPPPLAKFVLWGESILLERDIAVWNHKKYVKKPVLIREDALILKHRRWYSQFYSEDSLSVGECNLSKNDW
nr:Neverland [Lepeophtheirus salmonis salmonis]